ncbi:MAG: NTP transferase domain-containing protein [Actinomycetota bacterium]
MTVAAAVLAAGAGSRFAGDDHKLRAAFRGRAVLSWVLDAVDEAGFDQVFVVSGAARVDDLVGPNHTVIHNEAWADGQATSMGLAVDAAATAGHDALVIGLADQPLVPASAWRGVAAEAGEIVTATFAGKRRPPVKLSSRVWPDLVRSGDTGARELMARRADLVRELPCQGNPIDIDTLEDLQRWS